jgi:ABC-type sugar transport system ATPase subunit
VHALVGENGAGKSTLGRMIAGVHQADVGTMEVNGRPVRYSSPRAALADGITIIAQELTLVPQRSVVENVFLGNLDSRLGFVRGRELRHKHDELCELAGFQLDPSARVGSLRLADQQKVEILRAIARDAQLIVMDEPTAALTGDEAERLLAVIRALKQQGRTVVFVSHFLNQILAVADTVTVLRDGKLVKQSSSTDETVDTLVSSMLGRELSRTFPSPVAPAAAAPVVLSVRALDRRGQVNGASLDVRAGEIVGIAGLVGAGRTELVRTIFGAEPAESGVIEVAGVRRRIHRPRDAVRAGIAMVPESRKDQGLFMRSSIQRNVSLPHLTVLSNAGVLRLARERKEVESVIRRVGVRGAPPTAPVFALSGGNQQKTMFAKWLLRRPRVLIVDEPTRGVDVGAKQTIYELLHSLAAQGMALLVVSSEVEEVLGLSHRILVMRGGAIVAEFDRASATEEKVLQASFGAEVSA